MPSVTTSPHTSTDVTESILGPAGTHQEKNSPKQTIPQTPSKPAVKEARQENATSVRFIECWDKMVLSIVGLCAKSLSMEHLSFLLFYFSISL